METFDNFFDLLRTLWNAELFRFGNNVFTTSSLLFLVISFVFLFFLTSRISRLLTRRVFPRYNLDEASSHSMATITRYALLIIGFVIIFQSSGINLSSLGILFGALGIGIGFGLQNITSNFISGVIILFEKPIKIGDRVEVDKIVGNITKISARATTVINNDNIAVIVPNSDFINSKVINWSLNDQNVRFNFPVGVSYKEDPQRIKKLLMEVAHANPGVLKEPPPDVLFDDFGDSSLNFILRVWTTQYSNTPFVLKSQLYYSVFEKFKENDVEIPYPQRDLHLKTGFPKI